jgi:hypothetical protein
MGINAEERATNAAKRKKIDFPTTVIINIVWYDLDKQIKDFSESKDGARPVGADDRSVTSTVPNAYTSQKQKNYSAGHLQNYIDSRPACSRRCACRLLEEVGVWRSY